MSAEKDSVQPVAKAKQRASPTASDLDAARGDFRQLLPALNFKATQTLYIQSSLFTNLCLK